VNPLKLRGVGGLDVYIQWGYRLEQRAGTEVIAYEDLDGLYLALGQAIASRHGRMTGEELRFLRKQLGLTQEQVGAMGEKGAQVAAKWEKGELQVPRAEATLLRLHWLNRFAKKSVREMLERSAEVAALTMAPCYVFRRDGKSWIKVEGTQVQATHYSAAVNAVHVIEAARVESAMSTASFGVRA
jgi:DNA-binding transcriptional regulator YiaG